MKNEQEIEETLKNIKEYLLILETEIWQNILKGGTLAYKKEIECIRGQIKTLNWVLEKE